MGSDTMTTRIPEGGGARWWEQTQDQSWPAPATPGFAPAPAPGVPSPLSSPIVNDADIGHTADPDAADPGSGHWWDQMTDRSWIGSAAVDEAESDLELDEVTEPEPEEKQPISAAGRLLPVLVAMALVGTAIGGAALWRSFLSDPEAPTTNNHYGGTTPAGTRTTTETARSTETSTQTAGGKPGGTSTVTITKTADGRVIRKVVPDHSTATATATATATVTKTVTTPGGTTTITQPAAPAPITTVTTTPKPGPTTTVTAQPGPAPTVTSTVTASPDCGLLSC